MNRSKTTEKIELIAPQMFKEEGFCWVVTLSGISWDGDSSEYPRRSRLRLWEDDNLLSPAHAPHQLIRLLGGGRYSHWEARLYFATSDGSDPRTNGRSYVVDLGSEREYAPPGIYLNCLPKSGSEYIATLLSQGLCAECCESSGGVFPDLYAQQNFFVLLRQNRWISRGHEPYNRYHKIQIGEALDKMVVHVRDPRAAALSFCHYLPKLWQKNPMVAEYHGITPTFFSKPFSEQLDWTIECFMPIMVKWINGWLDAEKDSDFKTEIFFTTFERFKLSNQDYVNELLSFYGIDRSCFTWPPLQPKSGALNFRKGSVDEWRTTFSASQMTKATQLIDDSWFERFGWEK